MEYSITKESGRPQSYHQEVDVLVEAMTLAIFVEQGQEGNTNERTGTDQ